MSTTIRDVAAAAGVSITTVSHVLSGQGRITEKTREHVLRTADRLGYRANVHAQQLVTRRSRTLAIQIANSVDSSANCALVPNSDYFLEVLNGASEAAADRSYALILIPPDADLDGMRAFAVDGAILVDPRGDEPFFSDGWDSRPLVTTGRPINPRRAVPVVVDNDLVRAGELMVSHLLEQGYRQPALITTDTSRSYTSDIMAGYRKAAAAHGVDAIVVEVDEPPTREGTGEALGRLLDRHPAPDAIFTSAENLALSVLHEAQRRGVNVPGELGICSAVDSGSLQLTSPRITGMFVYPRDVGRAAATALVNLVEGAGSAESRIEIPIRLNVRDSTLRP
ncbi:LacI family DNA-binding transcriptional regulator [Pseudonocardia spinosispora]|uniref:LacI family DNA-binding transcriptional regulator n=1 Tax=Pseudonocardia spinosispora TaxID=103441 RepID=UPI0003FA5356|nr:LacI family DNA-binding transcriptional regulator [Pseudonocardia spinosispora]